MIEHFDDFVSANVKFLHYDSAMHEIQSHLQRWKTLSLQKLFSAGLAQPERREKQRRIYSKPHRDAARIRIHSRWLRLSRTSTVMSQPIQKFYQIDLGIDSKGQYHAQVYLLTEKKGIGYREPSLKLLLPRVRKALLQKDKEMRRFPLPTESAILDAAGHKMFMQNGHVAGSAALENGLAR